MSQIDARYHLRALHFCHVMCMVGISKCLIRCYECRLGSQSLLFNSAKRFQYAEVIVALHPVHQAQG